MNPQTLDIRVLDDGQTPPPQVSTPPRAPRWYDTFAYMANPDQFCRTNLSRYGSSFKTSVFGGTTVFVGSAQANQMVFNGDLNYTEIALPPTTMAMFGEYSLFQRPDLHRQRKSALQPGFTGRMLAGYLPQMHQVIGQHLQTWNTMAAIPLVPNVEQTCFDILVPLLLGIRLEKGNAAFDGLPVSSKAELKQLYKTFFDGFYGLVQWRSPLTAFGRGMQARSRLLEFMRAVIQRRKTTDAVEPTADFLAMMLDSQKQNPDGVFSDALIENQCLLQLWASHYEVTGLISSWLYQVGRHPHLRERLRSEQWAVLGTGGIPDLQMEQLKQMTFLDATIKETLRTLPPTSTANRRLTRSVVLDGVLYEKGWTLIAEPRIAHALESHFAAPDVFDPDRFLPERGEGKLYEFIPFGGGVHACLGAQMAIAMTKLFASHMLHRFDWTPLGEASFVQFPLKKIDDNYRVQLSQRYP